MTIETSDVKRCTAREVFGVGVSTGLNEKLHHLKMVVESGLVERCTEF